MEITLAQIETAETDVGRLEAEEARMRQAAQADGTIDPTEQANLDRILGKIQQGRALVTRLRAEYEANKAIWDGKAGDLATLQSQTSELTAWGEPAAADLTAQIAEMANLSGAEQWKAATAALAAAQGSILAPYAEYQRQSAAKAIYDPARSAHAERAAAVSATDLMTPQITAEFTSLAQALTDMDAKAAGRDYVAAQAVLDGANAGLDGVEAEIAELTRAREAYRTARADLDARMGAIAANDIPALQSRVTEMAGKVTAIDGQAAGFDFAGALAATQTAIADATALQTDIETARLARDAYQALLDGLEARIAAAMSDEGGAELALKLAEVQAEIDAAKALADSGDYAGASTTLEQAATMMGGFEELLAVRRTYLERLAVITPKIVERSVSDEQKGYLADPVQRMAAAQTAMEGAAKALEYPEALARLTEIEGILAEIDAMIEAQRQQFETERGILVPRLEKCETSPYPEIKPRCVALRKVLDTANADAAGERFDAATAGLVAMRTELDAIEAAHAKIEADLLAKIEGLIAPVEAKLPGLATPASPGLPALQKLVAGVRAKMSTKTDLLKAVDEATEASKQVGELEKVHTIMKRIEAKTGSFLKDEARLVVDELKASGDLNALPMEARNYLVDKLMSGTPSAADHGAIQSIWSQEKFVDRQFDGIDAPIRKKIVDKFLTDPAVAKYKADWPTMTDAQKLDAIKAMCAIPSGADGWNMGMPGTVQTEKTPDSADGTTSFGAYNNDTDTMTVNIHPDAEAYGFTEMVDTIVHELGHKHQQALVKGLDNGTIKPGDAAYNQAVALKLHNKYRDNHYAEFKKIYKSSPKESHSRKAGDEIKAALNAPPPAPAPAPGGGP
jgi:hypothetical protein